MNLKNLYPEKEYKVTELLNAIGFSRSILNNLIKKGVFRIEKRNVSSVITSLDRIMPFNDLTYFQKGAPRAADAAAGRAGLLRRTRQVSGCPVISRREPQLAE